MHVVVRSKHPIAVTLCVCVCASKEMKAIVMLMHFIAERPHSYFRRPLTRRPSPRCPVLSTPSDLARSLSNTPPEIKELQKCSSSLRVQAEGTHATSPLYSKNDQIQQKRGAETLRDKKAQWRAGYNQIETQVGTDGTLVLIVRWSIDRAAGFLHHTQQ